MKNEFSKTSGFGRAFKRGVRGSVSVGALMLPLFTAGAAFAQSAPQSAQAADIDVEEVVVSASRIARQGFDAPTPVTVMGVADLQRQGTTNITQLLNQLPAIQPSATNASNSQNSGGKYINLRGLGSFRNLVLVDGRRHVASRPDNSVDANVIPATLVERTEVVTGGASAAWGSDAVSGVINLILRKDLDGFIGNLQTSVSQRGDAFEYSGSLGWGTSFANERGHFMIAGESVTNEGIDPRSSRKWAEPQWALVSNPAYAVGNGQYRLIAAPNATQPFGVAGTGNAVIVSGPLKGTAFSPTGQPIKFNYGTAVGAAYMIGGDGFYMGKDLIMIPPSDRQNAFTRLTYQLTDDIEGFVEGSYVRSAANSVVVYKYDNSLAIQRDNAFLPPSIVAQMTANNLNTINIGRVDLDLPRDDVYVTNTTRRGAGGLKGVLGDDWTWDVYFQHGMNKYNNELPSNRVEANWRNAIDSVVGPNGTIMCRSSIANPNNGCTPYNPFVVSPKNDAIIRYVSTRSWQIINLTQNVAAANVNGTIFETAAGPVSLATGIEWRQEKIYGISDPISEAGGFRLGNQKGIVGDYTVKEGYVETVVPLLKGQPGAELLEFNGAARITDYTTSGTVETWKVGVNYQPVNEIRFRGTWSRDIRAPSVSDLFTAANTGTGTIIDRATNTQVSNIPTVRRGNPVLNPERADSLTGGVIYEPEWFAGFRASVDYYDIRIKDAIGSISGQNIVDRCFTGSTNLCALITRNAAGGIASIDSPTLNLSRISTSGIDMEAVYGFNLDEIFGDAPGHLNLRVLATYLNSYVTDDGVTRLEQAGEIGSSRPHWRAFASVAYDYEPWSWFLSARWIGSGTLDNTYGQYDILDNHVSGRVYFDTSLTYDLINDGDRSVQLYGRVQNLLDADPPIIASSATNATVTNDTLFDPVGRSFAVGVRFKY